MKRLDAGRHNTEPGRRPCPPLTAGRAPPSTDLRLRRGRRGRTVVAFFLLRRALDVAGGLPFAQAVPDSIGRFLLASVSRFLLRVVASRGATGSLDSARDDCGSVCPFLRSCFPDSRMLSARSPRGKKSRVRGPWQVPGRGLVRPRLRDGCGCCAGRGRGPRRFPGTIPKPGRSPA